MTQLTETTSNYNMDRNDCQKQPFDTTFYIAIPRRLTPTRLHSDADSTHWLQKTDCATIARQQPRDTAVLSIYSRPMATVTNRNSGVAVKDKYNV